MSRGQRFKMDESEIRSQKALIKGINILGSSQIGVLVAIAILIVVILNALKYIIPIAIAITAVVLIVRAIIKKKKYDAEMREIREKIRKDMEEKEPAPRFHFNEEK